MQHQQPASLASTRAAATDGGAVDAALAVVIVEAQLTVRKRLELLLCGRGHDVAGATRSPERAADIVAARHVDVVLVDVDLGAAAIALARLLLREWADIGVLLLSGGEDPARLADALACGAHGLALKAGPPEELLDAIVTVSHGDTWLDPRLARLLRPQAHAAPGRRLSPREREVLLLLADGLTGRAIAGRLFLSPETVRTHVRNAMRKLDARTRSHAIALVVRGRNGSPDATR